MIKTIINIMKYTIIFALASTAIYALLWFLGILDWSLFKWGAEVFAEIDWQISDIFNYPNAWILFSYWIGRDMIFFGLSILLGLARKGRASE